jgi:hypothetical protein
MNELLKRETSGRHLSASGPMNVTRGLATQPSLAR